MIATLLRQNYNPVLSLMPALDGQKNGTLFTCVDRLKKHLGFQRVTALDAWAFYVSFPTVLQDTFSTCRLLKAVQRSPIIGTQMAKLR